MQAYVQKLDSHTLASRYFRRALLSIILLEVFLGGGGRLIDVGVLSIRMYLFLFGLVLGLCVLLYRPILQKKVLTIVLFLIVTVTIGVVVAIFKKAPSNLILEDIKPLMFLFSMIFMVFLIKDESDVDLIGDLLRFSALLLAIVYLFALVLINTGTLPFKPFYDWASGTQEFFFRGEFAFFYKGFFFMCTGMFFYRWNSGLFSKFAILTIFFAVMLTFTRGFMLAFFVVIAINILLIKRRLNYLILFLLITALAAPFVWNFVSNAGMIDRQTSNNNRIIQIVEVADETTLTSTFIGHGFGRNIPSRQDLHLEIAYLEIFYKQGILGLAFWAFFFYQIYRLYRRAVIYDPHSATSFFLAVLFAYVQSITNPFINNPLGLTLLIVSIISLQILANKASLIKTTSPDERNFLDE